MVTASPMTAAEAEAKGYRTSGADGDGMEVTYQDGYMSWCPKSVFGRDYSEVRDTAKAAFMKMSVSPDFKDRFRGEYGMLAIRRNALRDAIDGMERGDSAFEPNTPIELFKEQLDIMNAYAKVLEKRSELEGIELDVEAEY